MPDTRKLPLLSSGWWLGVCVAGVLGLAGYGRQQPVGGGATDEPPAETPLQLRVQRIDSWVEQRSEAIPTLRRLVTSGDRRNQQDAVTALARLGEEAAPARDELEGALSSPDVQVREMAVYALASLPVDRSCLLTRVSSQLRDPAREVRRAAARALEKASDEVLAEALDTGEETVPY
ncbi:MAG: HEAT repeat domain-containing protein, partial [Planctomycetaceae bacterium]